MLNDHRDQTLSCTCTKTQPTAVSTLHVVAMHVPETNIPLKCHMYATKETNTCADMKPPCQYICLK